MSTENPNPNPAEHSSTTPFEDGLYQRLKDPEYAAYFLADAFEETYRKGRAVESAVRDVICANRDDKEMPFLALYFAVPHLKASGLERLVDFAEEELDPEVRMFLTGKGIFRHFRNLVVKMRHYKRPPDTRTFQVSRGGQKFNIEGISDAISLLKGTPMDMASSKAFKLMERVLVAA